MASRGRCSAMVWLVVCAALLVSLSIAPAADAQLTPDYYDTTCPDLASTVMDYMVSAIANETRIAASLLRLHFHDCFVAGCDASVLLDPTSTNPGEKNTIPNINSLRGFDVIDSIKAGVEAVCPGVVSCADIVALASFFSVVLSGGPSWSIPLGRRDALSANSSLPLVFLPGPQSTVPQLEARFLLQNLTTTDVVSLSGGHTIGLARCVSFNARLFNFSGTGAPDPTLNTTLLASLQTSCPIGGDGNVTRDLDLLSNATFDNGYFQDLITFNGLMNSDEVLYTTSNDTQSLVELYAANETKFFEDFVESMIKMGNLNPLTGTEGEIRLNCRVANPSSIKTATSEEEIPISLDSFLSTAGVVSEDTAKSIPATTSAFSEGDATTSSLSEEAATTSSFLQAAAEFIQKSIKKVFPDLFLGDELDHLVEESVATS